MKSLNLCCMIETDIFNYKTPEFFINMKSIPDKNSAERPAFIKEERRKCREGININGVPIVGGLYTHLNYYNLSKDDEGNTGPKKIGKPNLRDVDWIIFNDYAEAVKQKKIYTLFGLRQIGKSEIETSLILRELSLYKNTEGLALFSSKKDKDTFVKKARIALTYGEKFIYVPNIDQDWDQEEIRFGITKVNNEIELQSTLYIYLTREGKNIQVASGKTPSFVLMDEIAKSDMRLVYEAVEPALLTDFGGLRCAPIFTFTGGEVEKSKDAENLVRFPDADKQMIYDWEGKEVGGRFLTGEYRKDCKEKSTLSEYLNTKTNTWLDDYPIYVSNKEKAREITNKELDSARKLPDTRPLILKRIFNPMTLDDVFLTQSDNPFDIDGLQRHLEYLKANPQGIYVDLFLNENADVRWTVSKKKPILEYPTPKGADLDAPIIIYDLPKHTEHYSLHVAGFDPINNLGQEANSDSLASIFVMRRNHTDIHDPFRNCIVAEYTARPKSFTRNYLRNVELLQKFYNMQILHEDSGNAVTLYFDKIQKTHVLMDTFNLQKSMNPKSKANNVKGLRASEPNNAVRLEVVVNYSEEELGDGQLGYTRIPSPALIQEMIAFDGMGKGSRNVDRFDAFSYALLQVTTLEKYNKVRPFVTHVEKSEKPQVKLVRDSFGRTNVGMVRKNAFGY